jgi:hypothetical protein
VAAAGLPDLGIVAAAETGVALERLALVPAPGARVWPTVVAALLDAIDVVLVRSPAGLPAAQARRLAARARERGAVLVPLGAWPEPADLRLAVTSSTWQGLGQGHGSLRARRVEVVATGRGAATRERRVLLWLPSPDGTITPAAAPGAVNSFEASAEPGAVDPEAPIAPGAVDNRAHRFPRSATLPLRGSQQRRVGFPRAPAGIPAGNGDVRVGPGSPAGLALAGDGDVRVGPEGPAGLALAGDGDVRVGPEGPAGLALAGEGDAPAGEGRPLGEGGSQAAAHSPEVPLADAG